MHLRQYLLLDLVPKSVLENNLRDKGIVSCVIYLSNRGDTVSNSFKDETICYVNLGSLTKHTTFITKDSKHINLN